MDNERIRIVCDQGGAVWDTVFLVSPTETGTQLEMTMDAKPYKLMAKIMTPLINGMIKKFVRRDMEELKAWCEQLCD